MSIVGISPLSAGGEGGGGVEPPTKFSKRGLGQFVDLRRGFTRRRGVVFLRGGGGLIP